MLTCLAISVTIHPCGQLTNYGVTSLVIWTLCTHCANNSNKYISITKFIWDYKQVYKITTVCVVCVFTVSRAVMMESFLDKSDTDLASIDCS